LVDLKRILVARRRRKPVRADAPRTIPGQATSAAKLDAARARLRKTIPPRRDDDD
jgi:hypothetical protein